MRKFDSINVGDQANLHHLITQSDIDHFVELTGDDNKLHVDNEYASNTSYKKPVAHGMLGASFISTIIGTKLPGDGALWFSQSLEFLLPVRVGDTITVKAVVISKNEKSQTLEIATDIFNQHKQKITSGKAKVKVIEQEETIAKNETATAQKMVAIVLGGTGGIGQATCKQLSKDGFKVAIHYNSNKGLAEKIKDEIISTGMDAIIVKADITDLDEAREMTEKVVRKFDTITVVVNCTTLSFRNIKFSEMEWRDIQSHIDVNIKGTFNIIKCVIPWMEQSKFGKIICISTQYVEDPKSELTHYITAKSGLSGFVKALAKELGPKGIRVNLISPGMTDTELIADVPEKIRLLTATTTPLRRLSKPQDVAGAISFLASDKSDFITGETIRVNGGQTML